MKTKTLTAAFAAATLSVGAQAALLNFDDSSLSDGTTLSSYGGMTWKNIGIATPGSSMNYNNTGFVNGLKSAPNVAASQTDTAVASFGTTQGFLLNSGWFTSASLNGLILDFTGTSGATKFSKSVTLSVLQPLFVKFDWTIDELVMATRCETGTNNDCTRQPDTLNFGQRFVMDDLSIGDSNNTVPEPGVLALLGASLLGMTLLRRRGTPAA